MADAAGNEVIAKAAFAEPSSERIEVVAEVSLLSLTLALQRIRGLTCSPSSSGRFVDRVPQLRRQLLQLRPAGQSSSSSLCLFDNSD